ncbi:hypothetical protein [Pseudomonas oryzihabitans]|uniref:hypothetical protein n=1 Tax=Pseudomonas oryzihabitans TaxID=47885 RepID=UPI003EBF1ACE
MDAEIKGFWFFVCSLFGVGLGTFLIGFLGKTQIENRLRASIDHEYSKDLERIKDEIIRDQVKAIEELKREFKSEIEPQRLLIFYRSGFHGRRAEKAKFADFRSFFVAS